MTEEQNAALLRVLRAVIQSDKAEAYHDDTWLLSQMLTEPTTPTKVVEIVYNVSAPLTKQMIQDVMDHTKPKGFFKTYNYYTEWFTKFTMYVEGLHTPNQG